MSAMTDSGKVKPAILMGRLANGFALDAGHRVHLVPASTGQYSSATAALCGTKPGRTSGGWDVEYPSEAPANCPRCVRKSAVSP